MKPILFNTEMVKAILEGRKTQTRRVVKKKHSNTNIEFFTNKYGTRLVEMQNDVPEPVTNPKTGIKTMHLRACADIKMPYQVGDVLYVRETWAIQSMSNFDKRIKFMYKANGERDLEIRTVSPDRYEKLLKYDCKNGWQPSLFMPKEAARIFLEVKDVRAERLQNITEEGAIREGIKLLSHDGKTIYTKDYRTSFKITWNNIYNNWDANPWVWVIEFERIEKVID